jgi:hypothetical protein
MCVWPQRTLSAAIPDVAIWCSGRPSMGVTVLLAQPGDVHAEFPLSDSHGLVLRQPNKRVRGFGPILGRLHPTAPLPIGNGGVNRFLGPDVSLLKGATQGEVHDSVVLGRTPSLPKQCTGLRPYDFLLDQCMPRQRPRAVVKGGHPKVVLR